MKFKVGDKVAISIRESEDDYLNGIGQVIAVDLNPDQEPIYRVECRHTHTINNSWVREHNLVPLAEEPVLRKIGDVLLDLEKVLDEMCDQGLQLGDIHGLVHSHIWAHRQDAIEVYEEDNSRPILKYGHKDQV